MWMFTVFAFFRKLREFRDLTGLFFHGLLKAALLKLLKFPGNKHNH